MSLNSRLDSHQICNGEFIVLVPFAKKSQQLSSPPKPAYDSTIPPLSFQDSSMSSAANSAWLDMMSELSDVLSDSAIPSSSSYMQKFSLKKEMSMSESLEECLSTNAQKKRKVDGNHALHDILNSHSKDVFDEQIRMKISQFVGLANCLSNSKTGRCLLFERFCKRTDKECCMCPPWLKKVMKCFSFLNIFYAFFHSQQKCLTWKVIEEALKHPSNFGLDGVCISDLKNLSILSPKVILIFL